MTTPDEWGPLYWKTLKIVVENGGRTPSDKVAFIGAMANALPCQVPCAQNFRGVLSEYPPERYMSSDLDVRRQWYDLVREAVRKQEEPKTLPRILRRHRFTILRVTGYVVLLILAGFVGALIFRRYAEKHQ